jgi:hypothetical protein
VTPAEISLVAGFSFAVAHAIMVGVCLRFVRRLAPVLVHLLCAMVIGAAIDGILQALYAAPEGRLMLESVARNFVLPRFAERIDLLVAGGMVTRTESGYAITPQGLKAVHRLQLIQRIFAISGKGFYLTS